jgi:hypothetical protein
MIPGGISRTAPAGSGLEALVYRDREQRSQLPVPGRSKTYLQALYD